MTHHEPCLDCLKELTPDSLLHIPQYLGRSHHPLATSNTNAMTAFLGTLHGSLKSELITKIIMQSWMLVVQHSPLLQQNHFLDGHCIQQQQKEGPWNNRDLELLKQIHVSEHFPNTYVGNPTSWTKDAQQRAATHECPEGWTVSTHLAVLLLISVPELEIHAPAPASDPGPRAGDVIA